jgi:DNA-binding transcriptional LysR family regulator
LRHLRAFLAVAQAGSTAGAARQLNVSQPSVSVSIKELEMILGRPLFERLPARGLVPTSFGQRKIPEARALGAALAAFEQSGGGEEEPAGQVAFGYFSTLGPQYVPGILARMTRRYPKISVQPVEADLGELGRLLNAGRVELALSYDVEIGPGIAVERIAELDPYALLPVGHRLTRRRAVTPRELAGDPLVLVDLPLSGEFLLSVFRAEGIEPRIAHRTHSLEMVVGLVANGLGVAVLVTKRAGDRAYDGKRIVRRPFARSNVRQGVVLARPEWSPLTPPGLALAGCIREMLAEGRGS